MSRLARWLLLVLALGLPVLAQQPPDLKVSAWFSVGDNVHPDRYLPITIEVQNLGQARHLTLSFQLGQREMLDPVQLDVPAGATQRYEVGIPRFEGWNNEMDLVVREQGRQEARTKIKFETMSEGLAVAVLVPDGQSAFNYLLAYNDFLGTSGNSNPPPIRLSSPRLDGLPSQWSGYLATDMVVLYELPRLNLTEAQIQALADWTAAGGTLVLVSSGDPTEYRGTALEPLLPVQLTGSRDEESFPLVIGALRPGAEAVKERGGSPVLAQARVGQGYIFQFTFPILKDSVLGGDKTKAYWQRPLEIAFQQMDLQGSFGLRGDNLLRKLDEMMLPAPGLLAWLLLGYVLLVGPVNFAILKKRDRMLWIFVSVPAIALTFTLGMFLTTQLSHGASNLVREVARLRVRSGETGSVTNSQLSLFSPFPAEFRINCPRGATALIEPIGAPLESQPPALVAERMTYPALPMQMASLRRISACSVTPLQGAITFRIRSRQGENLELEVDNQSGYALENCCLVIEDRASQAFSVPVGPSKARLQLGAFSSTDLSLTLLGKPDISQGRPGDRVALLGRELTYAQGLKVPVLLGWSDKLSCGLEISGHPIHKVDCLVEVEAP